MMQSGGFRPVAGSEKQPENDDRVPTGSFEHNSNSNSNSNTAAAESKLLTEEDWLKRVFPSGRTHALTFSMELFDTAGKRVVRYVAFIAPAASPNNSNNAADAQDFVQEEMLEDDMDTPLVCYIHASSGIAATSKQAFVSLLDFVTELGCEDVFLAMDKPENALPDEALRVYRYLNFELVHPRQHKVQNALLLRYQM